MKVAKFRKIVMLSLIAIIQMITIIGGFFAMVEMVDMMSKLQWEYTKLLWQYTELLENGGLRPGTPGLIPNPFSPLVPLVLLGLFLTIVLLVDEISHKPAPSRE